MGEGVAPIAFFKEESRLVMNRFLKKTLMVGGMILQVVPGVTVDP